MSAEEFDPTDEQRKAAETLANSFSESHWHIGAKSVPKITLEGRTILSKLRNPFEIGFGEKSEDLRQGNVAQFFLDAIQFREVCAANENKLEEWSNLPDEFRAHCKKVYRSYGIQDSAELSQIVMDCVNCFFEILDCQVIAKEDKSAKGKGATPKKKARSRAKRRNTSSR